jgi:hypothetical protein
VDVKEMRFGKPLWRKVLRRVTKIKAEGKKGKRLKGKQGGGG